MARLEALFHTHERAWLGPIESLAAPSAMAWARGFLDSCALADKPVVLDSAIEHREWRVLRVLDTGSPELPFEQIARVICQRAMANLRALATSLPVLQLVVESATAPELAELDFAPAGRESVVDLLPLLAADCFARLRKLYLHRCPYSAIPQLPPNLVVGVLGPPRSLAGWLTELTVQQATLAELRLMETATRFDHRGAELVLHGDAGRWNHLEVRWAEDDARRWRDEVIAAVGQLAADRPGALQRLSFVGPPTARFDVARFKQRVITAAPGALVVD